MTLIAFPLSAHALTLQWPLACTLGDTCFIQNYFDHDPGPGMVDYQCRHHVYEDGHDGIDIRVRDGDAMRAGVAVTAAADGIVRRTRDGMADVANDGAHDANNRDCGNAVVLKHAEGFETVYCHLRKGSVRVKPGDAIKAGAALGLVGMSGFANYPHVHFMLLKDGSKLDPFTGTAQTASCNAPASPLWQQSITYAPSTVLGDGMTDTIPGRAAMRDHPIHRTELTASAPAMLYWVDMMHLEPGDALYLAILAPDGSTLAEHREIIKDSAPFAFRFLGKKKSAGSFAPGMYRGRTTLTRDGQAVLSSERVVTLR